MHVMNKQESDDYIGYRPDHTVLFDFSLPVGLGVAARLSIRIIVIRSHAIVKSERAQPNSKR